MLVGMVLGLVGGLTYTLIILNPGFRFSKLGISARDFFIALAVNAALGAVAGFLGWSLSAGELQPPKSYAVYLLFGVGGGSLIQSLALAVANKDSKVMLDRTLEAVEVLSTAQGQALGDEVRSISKSLRDTTDSQERQRLVLDLLNVAHKVRTGPRD